MGSLYRFDHASYLLFDHAPYRVQGQGYFMLFLQLVYTYRSLWPFGIHYVVAILPKGCSLAAMVSPCERSSAAGCLCRYSRLKSGTRYACLRIQDTKRRTTAAVRNTIRATIWVGFCTKHTSMTLRFFFATTKHIMCSAGHTMPHLRI